MVNIVNIHRIVAVVTAPALCSALFSCTPAYDLGRASLKMYHLTVYLQNYPCESSFSTLTVFSNIKTEIKCQVEDWVKVNCFSCLMWLLHNYCIKRLPAQTSISTVFPVESIVSMRKWLLIFRHIGIFRPLIADCCHTERLFYNNIPFVSQFCGHLKLSSQIEYTLCSGCAR